MADGGEGVDVECAAAVVVRSWEHSYVVDTQMGEVRGWKLLQPWRKDKESELLSFLFYLGMLLPGGGFYSQVTSLSLGARCL